MCVCQPWIQFNGCYLKFSVWLNCSPRSYKDFDVVLKLGATAIPRESSSICDSDLLKYHTPNKIRHNYTTGEVLASSTFMNSSNKDFVVAGCKHVVAVHQSLQISHIQSALLIWRETLTKVFPGNRKKKKRKKKSTCPDLSWYPKNCAVGRRGALTDVISVITDP